MTAMVGELRAYARAGGPSPDQYDELMSVFHSIRALVRDGKASESELQSTWPTLGDAFWSTDTTQGLGIIKPRGYAGDFEMIDRLYQEWLSPRSDLLRWDEFLHAQPATAAVRNRKDYFCRFLNRQLSGRGEGDYSILSVGCGPARECDEFLSNYDGPVRVAFECLDQDVGAVTHAAEVNANWSDRVSFTVQNAFRINSDRQYDLVWSAGLFDYLSRDQFIALLRKLGDKVRPGGQIAIGNFAVGNPTQDYMEFGHWFLNYRTEEELYDLARESIADLPPDHACVDREPEDINLFLHVVKPGLGDC